MIVRRGTSPIALAAAYWAAVVSPAFLLLLALSYPLPFEASLSILLALAGLMMIAIQFVTSGRFQLLARNPGIDVMMGFHRFAARVIIATVILHVLLEIWAASGGEAVRIIPDGLGMLTENALLSGSGATVLLILLFWMALQRDRLGIPYEYWRAAHGAAAIILLLLATHHARQNGSFMQSAGIQAATLAGAGIALGAVLVIYLYRGWQARRGGWVVDNVRPLAPKLHEVTLRKVKGPPFRFVAGQFVWVTLGRRHPITDHPFSIASAPEELPILRLVVKENGDFTSTIGELPEGMQAFLDGPHGSFLVCCRTDAVVLIAGGVGIAPVIGQLRSLAHRRFRGRIAILFATRDEAEQVFADELNDLSRQLDLTILLVVEHAAPSWKGHRGRVDREKLAALLDGIDPSKAEIILCGPAGMMSAVTQSLLELGVPLGAINYERFDYHEADDPKSRRVRAQMIWLFTAIGLSVVAAAWLAS